MSLMKSYLTLKNVRFTAITVSWLLKENQLDRWGAKIPLILELIVRFVTIKNKNNDNKNKKQMIKTMVPTIMKIMLGTKIMTI